MPEIYINYWAVLVAMVANIVVGSLWYGPVFGRIWKRLSGFTDENMKNMPLTPAQAYIGGFITAFLMAFVLAHDAFVWANFMGGGNWSFAFQLAFWIWLGYVATTQATSFLWDGKSWKLFAFNAAQSLVALIVMACILTFWK